MCPILQRAAWGGARSFLILAVNDRQRTIDNWRVGRGNDWVDQMLHGGMLTCEGLGYHLLFELIDTDPVLARAQLARVLSALSPDGVILTPPHSENPELARLLHARAIPLGRIGSSAMPDGINAFMSDFDAAGAAVRHLLALDHRRIGFVSGSEHYGASLERVRGYSEALAQVALVPEEGFVQFGDFSFASGVAAAERMLALARPPTAIIAGNDEMAFAVLHVAADRAIAVPEALSVISFDDTPGVRFSVPPLTAIRQPISALAATVSQKLIEASSGKAAAGNYVLPFELIERLSTARCPA
jgi:LacI family transcriptional regulator